MQAPLGELRSWHCQCSWLLEDCTRGRCHRPPHIHRVSCQRYGQAWRRYRHRRGLCFDGYRMDPPSFYIQFRSESGTRASKQNRTRGQVGGERCPSRHQGWSTSSQPEFYSQAHAQRGKGDFPTRGALEALPQSGVSRNGSS